MTGWDARQNLVNLLVQNGITTQMFSGYHWFYMNKRDAFYNSGFQECYFYEDYRKENIPYAPVWNGTILDAQLFSLPLKHLPQDNFFQFIITMDMHGKEFFTASQNLFPETKNGDFYTTCHATDQSIKDYVAALPDKTLVVIYRDHNSAFSQNDTMTPFLAYLKGEPFAYDGSHIAGLGRCLASHYLRKVLGLPPRTPTGASQ